MWKDKVMMSLTCNVQMKMPSYEDNRSNGSAEEEVGKMRKWGRTQDLTDEESK